jgi:hypothetical protein
MKQALRVIGQIMAYAAFSAVLVSVSMPAYQHHDPQLGAIKISFSHTGPRVSPCRRFTPEEIAALAPNMRRPMDCPRGRLPLLLEVDLDGDMLYSQQLYPTGLAGDGVGMVYERFAVTPGAHHLDMRLRDTRRETGFDYVADVDINIAPRENLTVDFRREAGGFVVRSAHE